MRNATLDHRDLERLGEEAEATLNRYAEALREWNAPDDEHTKFQIRLMADRALKRAMTND